MNGAREIMVMAEMPQRRPTFILKRGAYDAPGDPVEANVPERILPFAADLPRNRLGLAKWMTDPQVVQGVKPPLVLLVAVLLASVEDQRDDLRVSRPTVGEVVGRGTPDVTVRVDQEGLELVGSDHKCLAKRDEEDLRRSPGAIIIGRPDRR